MLGALEPISLKLEKRLRFFTKLGSRFGCVVGRDVIRLAELVLTAVLLHFFDGETVAVWSRFVFQHESYS